MVGGRNLRWSCVDRRRQTDRMASLRVLISGGGIAGATLAYWLTAGGHRVTIVERADQPSSSGSPVDVRGQAAAIARRWGSGRDSLPSATGVERLAFVDADGTPVAVIRTRRTKSAEEEVEVARADLATALLDTIDGSVDDPHRRLGRVAEFGRRGGGRPVRERPRGPVRHRGGSRWRPLRLRGWCSAPRSSSRVRWGCSSGRCAPTPSPPTRTRS